MPTLSPENLDLSVTMLLLVVVYRGLGILAKMYIPRLNPPPPPAAISMLACQQDPKHYQRIEEMHAMTMKTETEKADGKFNCNWKDRDEVRDMIEAMRTNVTAMGAVTKALTDLTSELRLNRNGHGK